MNRLTDNKIVLVMRPTRLAELVIRFNTVSQAKFYVEHQGSDFSDYLREDQTYHRALTDTEEALGQVGLVQTVDRNFLPNFVFAPEDTVVTLGQDGLVANTLKYLDGQPVVGVNPDPERWDGRLLPFRVRDLAKLMPEVVLRKRSTRSVTMAKASLNNGQTLYGVNDLFIGPKTHTSARYFIRSGGAGEAHSSSGVIVSTGVGATGWLRSLLTGAGAIANAAGNRGKSEPGQPGLYERAVTGFNWESDYLYFTVREPFPTKTTKAKLVFGRVTPESPLILESQMAENGVIFSDGIEQDFLEFNSGTKAVIGIAEKKGVLVE
ncbi:MAG TPA: sugar kinase [Candidatus Angelobacter sp.]|nr:sugar kinase [Candidatus Angelobacter sp.]